MAIIDGILAVPIEEWTTAIGLLIVAMAVLRVVEAAAVNRLRKFSDKSKTEFDDVIVDILDKLGLIFYFAIGQYIALQYVASTINPGALTPAFPASLLRASYIFLGLVVTIRAIQAVQRIVIYGAKIIQKQQGDQEVAMIQTGVKAINILLWLVGFLLLAQNLGYDVTALLAGLGIGGLAIAIALQSVLGDVFAAFTIYFDKPFEIGDVIIMNGNTAQAGRVMQIGIKSTRIQTLQGQQLIVSNKMLTDNPIENYHKMERRRIQFTFGATYDTPVQKLEKVPGMVKKIFDEHDMGTLDRVHFRTMGDFSLNYEVTYYVESKEFTDYLNVQEQVNLALMRAFEKEGIEFAFPTQTIHLEK